MELTVQQEQAERQLRKQHEELRVHSQKELQQVQEELARLQQDFNQSLLHAEGEKQQVCKVVASNIYLYEALGLQNCLHTAASWILPSELSVYDNLSLHESLSKHSIFSKSKSL